MNDDYRARATKAEQENAHLREKLKTRPKHESLVNQLKDMLGLGHDVSANHLVQKIKILRDNQELYQSQKPERKRTRAEEQALINEGIKIGRAKSILDMTSAILEIQKSIEQDN